MAKDRIYETDDGTRIAPLSALNDFEVAEGYPDIRGWQVASADGQEVGKVHDLLIDVDQMRTRYLDVRLTKALAASPGDRDVLVPIGTAQVVEDKNVVRVPLTAERVGLLPVYEHGALSRTHELEVRRHFSLGEAAAAAAAGTAATTAARDFYDNEGYDDRRFFGKRRPVREDKEIAERRIEAERAEAARVDAEREAVRRDEEVRRDATERAVERDARDASDKEIRVPVQPDDAVVLKRGDDGRDEIIIRRPTGERRI
jgi:sporulation protein YlmC with PRC-barrel domain